MIPFGPFEPDKALLDTGLSAAASNVIPRANHYSPLPGLSAYSAALSSKSLGAAFVRKTDGTTRVFAGDSTTLNELQTDVTWSDISKSGGYSVTAGEFWWFRRFGANLIAGSGNAAPQYIAIDAGTAFADLGGSPPQARYAANIGPHLMLGSLNTEPDTVQACAAADATTWTTGGGTNGIKQQFEHGGHVKGVTSGRLVGYVFQEHAIRRAALTQDNALFQFDLITDDLGVLAPTSIVQKLGRTFFLSDEGFYAFDGQTFSRIGLDRVDKYFFDDVQASSVLLTYGAADPKAPVIYWFYYSGSATTYADKCLIYNYVTDMWATGTLDVSVAVPLETLAISIDSVDTVFPGYNVDTFPWSPDDRIFQGVQPGLAAFGSDDKLSFFDGSNLEATVETGEVQYAPGQRSFVQGVTPIFDGDDDTAITVAMAAKDRSGGSYSFGTAMTREGNGECPQRLSGRYHRARVVVPAASTWTKLHGLDLRAVKDGMR